MNGENCQQQRYRPPMIERRRLHLRIVCLEYWNGCVDYLFAFLLLLLFLSFCGSRFLSKSLERNSRKACLNVLYGLHSQLGHVQRWNPFELHTVAPACLPRQKSEVPRVIFKTYRQTLNKPDEIGYETKIGPKLTHALFQTPKAHKRILLHVFLSRRFVAFPIQSDSRLI